MIVVVIVVLVILVGMVTLALKVLKKTMALSGLNDAGTSNKSLMLSCMPTEICS